jgi:hypothetical protein
MGNMILKILLFPVTYECKEGVLNLLQIKANCGNKLTMEGSLQYKQEGQLCCYFCYYGQKHIMDVFHIITFFFIILVKQAYVHLKSKSRKTFLPIFVCVCTDCKCNFGYVCITFMILGK